MLCSRNLVFAPLFGVCLAALAGCSNPPAASPTPPVSAGAPAAGRGSVVPVGSVAGSPVLSAGTSAVAALPAAAIGGKGGVGGSPLTAAGSGGSGGSVTRASAGNGGAGGSDTSGAGAGGAAGDDPLDLGNLIPDVGGGNSGGSTNPPAAGSCQDLVCFDIFDCTLWHPDEAATCNFTACENFVCK
jgi:hypothetical protein